MNSGAGENSLVKRNIVWRSCKWLLGALLILALALVAGVLWLQSAPRQITELTTSFIASLQSENAPYELLVDHVEFEWAHWRSPAAIRLQGIRLKSAEYDTELQIASGLAELNLFALLLGDVKIVRLALESVDLNLLRQEGEWMLLGSEGELLYRFNAANDTSSAAIFPVESIAISKLSLSITDASFSRAIDLPDISFSLTKHDSQQGAAVNFQASGMIEEALFGLSGAGSIDMASGSADMTLKPEGLSPVILCDDWLNCSDIPLLSVPLSGTIRLTASAFVPQLLELDVRGEGGELSFLPHLPEALAIQSLALKGAVNLEQQAIELQALALAFDSGTRIDASGIARMNSEGEGFYLELDAQSENMPVNDLYKYWPEGLAPQTRTWATTRIRDGMATKASATIRVKPEDLLTEHLPDAFLATEIHVQDSTVNYIDRFPKAEKVNAIVRFTGTSMTADISSGRALEATYIKPSTIFFSDLNAEGTPVEVALNLTSNPKDSFRFMELLPRNALKALGISVEEAQGAIESEIKLAFDAFSEDGTNAADTINWDALEYKISANTEGLEGLRLSQGIVLAGVRGNVRAGSDSVYAVDMKGKLEDSPFMFRYDAPQGAPESMAFEGAFPAALLQSFFPKMHEYLSGVLDAKLSLTRTGDAWKPAATLDLTAAALTLSELAYRKAKGEPATLTLSSDASMLPDAMGWTYDSKGLTAQGALAMDRKNQVLQEVLVSRYVSQNQDFSLRYAPLEQEGFRLTLSGRKFDLTPLWNPDESENTPTTISNLPPMDLSLDVAEIQFPKGGSMRGVKGHLRCDAMRCSSADMQATLPSGGAAQMLIGSEGGNRHFKLTTSHLEELALLLDIHDKLHGGSASIEGVYDESKKGNPLTGRAVLENFIIKDAPILTKILNSASLTGLLDTLRGEGLRFDKFAGDFVFAEDLLTLKEAKAAGSSMGILLAGEINIGTQMIDVSGNLAPAHAVNSLVGKIPLIGEVIAGGAGESIIAIDFGVKGAMDDPSVTVNPLSALTPGFTRKFFEIFETAPDTTAPDTKAPESSAPAPEAAPSHTNPAATPKETVPENQGLKAPDTDGLQWQMINP